MFCALKVNLSFLWLFFFTNTCNDATANKKVKNTYRIRVLAVPPSKKLEGTRLKIIFTAPKHFCDFHHVHEKTLLKLAHFFWGGNNKYTNTVSTSENWPTKTGVDNGKCLLFFQLVQFSFRQPKIFWNLVGEESVNPFFSQENIFCCRHVASFVVGQLKKRWITQLRSLFRARIQVSLTDTRTPIQGIVTFGNNVSSFLHFLSAVHEFPRTVVHAEQKSPLQSSAVRTVIETVFFIFLKSKLSNSITPLSLNLSCVVEFQLSNCQRCHMRHSQNVPRKLCPFLSSTFITATSTTLSAQLVKGFQVFKNETEQPVL